MYGSKSKYRRKYARPSRGVKSTVAKTAKGRVSQVQALAKSVRSIQRQMKSNAEYYNFGQNGTQSLTSDLNYFCLTSPANWTAIFGSAPSSTQMKCRHLSAGIDLRVTLENTINEPDTTGFTCFIVSLKDEMTPYFAPTTGALTLNANQHYTIRQGMAMLNKKYFSIHRVKRFTLTNYGQSLSSHAAQSQYGTDKRWHWKVRFNKELINPQDHWQNMVTGLDPSKTFYCLTFNDNSSLDLQNPQLLFNVVHTIRQDA